MSEEIKAVTTPVDGYCINWGVSGIPELQPCTVQKTSHEGFYIGQVEPGVILGLTENEDFWTSFLPAVQALLKVLKTARMEHWMAVAYIEDQIETAEEVLRIGDEPCH